MTKVVNLNKTRKVMAVARAKAAAVENRIRFGRTKVERAFDAARADARTRPDKTPPFEPRQD